MKTSTKASVLLRQDKSLWSYQDKHKIKSSGREGALGGPRWKQERGLLGKEGGGVKYSCIWRALWKLFPNKFGKPGGISTSLTTLTSAFLCMFGHDSVLKSVIQEERGEHCLKRIHQPFLPSRHLAQGELLQGERLRLYQTGVCLGLWEERWLVLHSQPFDLLQHPSSLPSLFSLPPNF